jgi:hypothetical protein
MPNGDDHHDHIEEIQRAGPGYERPAHALQFVQGDRRTDEQIAAELRERLVKALGEVVVVCNEARNKGYYVEYGVPLDNFGRYFLGPVSLIKRF